MREAETWAIQPERTTQPDLIQAVLSGALPTASARQYMHAIQAAPLDQTGSTRIAIQLGGSTVPIYLQKTKWATDVGRTGKARASPGSWINNQCGHAARVATRRALEA